MKRKLRTYMEFEITTKQNEKELSPSVGGYVVIYNGTILPFDFGDISIGVKREGDILKFSTVQKNLALNVFLSDWKEDGFVPMDSPEDEIEDIIFNYIKESAELAEIYLEIFDKEVGNQFEDKITITSLVISDIRNDEDINLLTKTVHERALFKNIKIRYENKELVS